MVEHSEISAGKIAIIGLFGVILTTAAVLGAIVLYFAISDRVEESRIREAVERVAGRIKEIEEGRPPAQPWLDADLQYAVQEAALEGYAARTIKEENGKERIQYSMPIEQAMEAVLRETSHVAGAGSGEAAERASSPQKSEVES